MKKQVDIKLNGEVKFSNVVSSEQEKTEWIEKNESSFPVGYVVEETDITEKAEVQGRIVTKKTDLELCMSAIMFVNQLTDSMPDKAPLRAMFSNPTFIPVILALLTGNRVYAKELILERGAQVFTVENVNKIVAVLDGF